MEIVHHSSQATKFSEPFLLISVYTAGLLTAAASTVKVETAAVYPELFIHAIILIIKYQETANNFLIK